MIAGIECTAHTFGVGIANKGKVLSNIKDMYTTSSGGIVPTDCAKHHSLVSDKIFNEAIKAAKINEDEIEAIALSNAPGLSPCLISGLKFAKEKSESLNIPIIPINHCIAHLEIGKVSGASDPVLLYASGANTQIISYSSGKYRVFGETLDIGVGNLIDKFARFAGLGFPGGPKIEENAKRGKYIEIPYSIKGMDVSFSGIQTRLQQLLKKGESIEDLSYSLQENVFAMLIEAAERAMAHLGKSELLLGGGVSCNSRLQEMCKIMCIERGAKFFCPPREFLVDNGGMIAYLGEIILKSKNFKNKDINDIDISPRERTDQVDVFWK